MTEPFPVGYSIYVTKSVGALPKPARNPVKLATITTEVQAVDYARGGFHASLNQTKLVPNAKASWFAAAENYRFVHDLTTSNYRGSGLSSEQAGRWVSHLKVLLGEAEAPVSGAVARNGGVPSGGSSAPSGDEPTLPVQATMAFNPMLLVAAGVAVLLYAWKKKR